MLPVEPFVMALEKREIAAFDYSHPELRSGNGSIMKVREPVRT
jgi:hypothetical protein